MVAHYSYGINMASTERTEQLNTLVKQAGTDRDAVKLIEQIKGCSPTHSAIYKSRNGAGTDYVVQSYIDDLTVALATK